MELELLRRVGFFCALFTVQCCVSVLGTISRDTIFLRSYAASSIAALTLVLSFSTAYALTLANGLIERLVARNAPSGVVYALSPAVLGAGLLLLTVLSLAVPLLARGVSVVLYIWLEISTQWLTQQFWDLCAKAFDVSQSKKFFGFITFGTTFGSLLASFVVLPAVQSQQLPTEFNLLVAAVLLFFVAAVLFVSAEQFAPSNSVHAATVSKKKSSVSTKPKHLESGTAAGDVDASSSSAIISDIQARTYLKHICFFDMLATVIRVLVDNTTLSVLSLQQEEEVKASLTMINAVQSFLMIPMQLASGPFFTHFGVMYGISMLPVSVFLFGASTYVSNSERGRFQNFVCGPFRSLSRIFGAVLSMILTMGVVVQFLGSSSASALLHQELRALFYKTNQDNVPLTPLHTKLRLLNLHTAAKREFVLHAQESYLLPDASTFPTGVFNTMDLMMMIKDKSVAVPRQLRVAAILACGYEKFNMNAEQCSQILSKLVQSGDEEKSVVVCAAVALLRLSDWMDEEANIILQRLLHEEKVACVHLAGFRSLMKHLPDSVLRSQIVAALKGFETAALWGTLCQYTEETLHLPSRGSRSEALVTDRMQIKREGLAGALKVLEMGEFPLEDKLDFLLHLVETLLVTPNSQETGNAGEEGTKEGDIDVLHHLFGKDEVVEELVVDALLSLLMDPIHLALDIKIREAYEMRHVLELFNRICPRTATNIEETSPLLLQHVEHSLKDTRRMLLKLLSTGFPKEFDVAVILEGLQSDLGQVHSAIQKDIAAFFGCKNGVDVLLDVMKHQKAELELSALALQYFLHIAADHAEFLDEAAKTTFQDEIVPHLLKHELTKELLIETYHRQALLESESLDALMKETPRVSRGVLSAVASALQLLYFEPLRAIAQSGSLPRRDRASSLTADVVHINGQVAHPMVKITESLTTNIKAALSVDRAAKSFLYNVGRSRTVDRTMPLSLPGGRGRHRSLSGSPTPLSMTRSLSSGVLLSRGLLTLSDPADYSNFEKCIHLKASQLMRNLDDDKVSLVAQLSRVVLLSHGNVLYSAGATLESVYVIIDGSMEIANAQEESDTTGTATIKLHDVASAMGRCTLFEITTKELVDLSELHHDIMHVLLAWLSQTLAESTKTMIAPLVSPLAASGSSVHWEDEEEASELRNRTAKWRAESD
ncbi:hypothetical protein BBJ28_00015059 [Nothophytophthora sp. Chile5]|nr:hypothetical protein BBJ28_00015059 [Nothophytophthora sp. Chile5]